MLSLARGVFAGMRSAWYCVRWAWRITAELCHTFLVLPQQRNPCTDCKSAEQCTTRGNPYDFPKLHPGPCDSVGMRPRTDTQTRVTTIHFASSTTHAKCNQAQSKYTSMYSLTFHVRVTTPPQYERNGTASLQTTSDSIRRTVLQTVAPKLFCQ